METMQTDVRVQRVNKFHIVVYLCSKTDNRRCFNVIKTLVAHLVAPHVPFFCPYHTLTL